jgi:hypothetical protein
MRSIHRLSTFSTGLSTEFKDNLSLLTSTFTTYPQISITPITTTFIYKYLSPQANLWGATTHSFINGIYAKLSNLGVVNPLTDEMRAPA